MARGSGWAWFGGLAAGFAAGYFLDPLGGPERRQRALHRLADLIAPEESPAVELPPDALPAETNPWRLGEVDPELIDRRLTDRIWEIARAMLRRPQQLHVEVLDSIAVLRGAVGQDEIGPLLVRLRSVPGLWSVDSQLLTTPKSRGLNAGERALMAAIQSADTSNARAALVLGGMALTWTGFRRGGLLGLLAAAAGGAMLMKAGGAEVLDQLPEAIARDVPVAKAIDVAAPLNEVFGFWSSFANFPLFMRHLREVREDESGVSHWVADGPAGIPVSWNAEITRLQPHRRIAWASLPGSAIRNQGEVRFEEVEPGLTRVAVHMTYHPPAGAVGHAVASFFGADPECQLEEDLARFRDLVERRSATLPARAFDHPALSS